jgi:serine/threonine-protein kinase
LLVAMLTGIASPLVVAPALAATNAMLFALHLPRKTRPWLIIASVLAVVVPLLLELLGVVPPSFRFSNGTLILLPRVASLSAAPTLLALVATSVATAVTPTVLAGRVRDALEAAERKLFLHAWRLRQTLPESAGPSLAAPLSLRPPPYRATIARGNRAA